MRLACTSSSGARSPYATPGPKGFCASNAPDAPRAPAAAARATAGRRRCVSGVCTIPTSAARAPGCNDPCLLSSVTRDSTRRMVAVARNPPQRRVRGRVQREHRGQRGRDAPTAFLVFGFGFGFGFGFQMLEQAPVQRAGLERLEVELEHLGVPLPPGGRNSAASPRSGLGASAARGGSRWNASPSRSAFQAAARARAPARRRATAARRAWRRGGRRKIRRRRCRRAPRRAVPQKLPWRHRRWRLWPRWLPGALRRRARKASRRPRSRTRLLPTRGFTADEESSVPSRSQYRSVSAAAAAATPACVQTSRPRQNVPDTDASLASAGRSLVTSEPLDSSASSSASALAAPSAPQPATLLLGEHGASSQYGSGGSGIADPTATSGAALVPKASFPSRAPCADAVSARARGVPRARPPSRDARGQRATAATARGAGARAPARTRRRASAQPSSAEARAPPRRTMRRRPSRRARAARGGGARVRRRRLERLGFLRGIVHRGGGDPEQRRRARAARASPRRARPRVVRPAPGQRARQRGHRLDGGDGIRPCLRRFRRFRGLRAPLGARRRPRRPATQARPRARAALGAPQQPREARAPRGSRRPRWRPRSSPRTPPRTR